MELLSYDRSGTLRRDGAEIFWAQWGKADTGRLPVMLFHGNGEDHRYFVHQIAALVRWGYPVVAMDSRGQGRSTAGTLPWDFWLFAQDALALLDHLDLPQAHLLGFSDGGNLALHLALTDPSRVRSLVLNGANLNPSGMKTQVWASILAARAGSGAAGLLRPQSKRQCRLLDLMLQHPHLLPQQLSALPMPALVIAGQYDMIREEHTRLIAHSLPNSQLCILSGADHFCAAKAPAAFNACLLDFLQAVENGTF